MTEMCKLMCLCKISYENMLVLHHNVSGPGWFPTHEKLNEYYTTLEDISDSVNEIGILVGEAEPTIAEAAQMYPPVSTANRNEVDSFSQAKAIFDALIAQFAAAWQSLPPQYADIANKLQEHQFVLRKEADYKLLREVGGSAPIQPTPQPPVMDDEDDDMM